MGRGFLCAPGGTRTHDPLIKSQLLLPTELPMRDPDPIRTGIYGFAGRCLTTQPQGLEFFLTTAPRPTTQQSFTLTNLVLTPFNYVLTGNKFPFKSVHMLFHAEGRRLELRMGFPHTCFQDRLLIQPDPFLVLTSSDRRWDRSSASIGLSATYDISEISTYWFQFQN